nr:uncharacterized protein LOC104086617 [Nicotiana tomentosiformis]
MGEVDNEAPEKNNFDLITATRSRELLCVESCCEDWHFRTKQNYSVELSSNASVVWNDVKERFDKVDLSRIFQIHKSIATVNQGTSSISSYFSKLRLLWAEFDSLAPIPGCDCEKSREFVVFMERLKLLQFLMGLNESYEQARSQLLMMIPAPSVNKAYSMLMGRESQRAIAHTSTSVDSHKSDAFVSSSRGSFHQKSRRNYNLVCDYCNYKGHTRENCFKLNRYPADFKSKKKGGTFSAANFAGNSGGYVTTGLQMHTSGAQEPIPVVNFIGNNSGGYNGDMIKPRPQLTPTLASAPYFTLEQYKQILQMLGKINEERSSTQPTAKTTGIFSFLSRVVDDMWIVDTGATNHMVANSNLLNKLDEDSNLKGGKAHSPTGNVDIFSGQVRGIGREDCGLYYLKATSTSTQLQQPIRTIPICSSMSVSVPLSIWHNRLGHAPLDFDELVKENGMIHQSSCVYTPQQNGVVERKYRSILNVARSLKFQEVVPVKFWGECVSIVVYLLNRLPSVILQNKSSFELLRLHPPGIDHLRGFGCLAYASSPNVTDKLSARAIPAVLMGYSSTQKGYKIYDLHAKTFFVNRNVGFKENLFPFKHSTPSTSHLFLVLEPNIHTQSLSDFQHNDSQPTQEEGDISLASFPSILSNTGDQPSTSNAPCDIAADDSVISHAPATTKQLIEPLRKSSRTVKQPLWLQDYVTTKDSNCIYHISSYISYDQLTSSYKIALSSYSSILEPSTFKETAADPK